MKPRAYFTHLSRANGSAGSTHSLPGADDITRQVLPNGIVILTRPNFNSPSVVISGYVQAAALFEPDEKLGLANFTAASLMRGTQKRSFQEIYDTLESAGASFGFDSGTHSTGFGGKALVEDLDMLLELAAETLLTPTFPTTYVERLRSQILTGLAIRAQDTGEMASMALDEIIYAGHPYARTEEGKPETIKNIQREDLEAFHQKHFGPRGMVVAIVGAVEPQVVVEKVAAAFSEWQNPAQPEIPSLPPVRPLEVYTRRDVTIAGKIQSDIVMGQAGPARRSPDFLAASLGNNILGQFGMMGRIGDSVREKSGLAYYAYSSLSGGSGPGPWEVTAGVNPANVDRAIELIRHEIRRFTQEAVEADELSDTQANYIGRLPLTLESNGGVAGALINLERYDLGLDYYRHYADLIRAVTKEQILAAAQRYLDADRIGVAVAGPGAEEKANSASSEG